MMSKLCEIHATSGQGPAHVRLRIGFHTTTRRGDDLEQFKAQVVGMPHGIHTPETKIIWSSQMAPFLGGWAFINRLLGLTSEGKVSGQTWGDGTGPLAVLLWR